MTEASATRTSAKVGSVLVIEDDYAIRKFLRIILESNDYTCREVTTAAAAIDQLSPPNYAAIILDLGLPDRDGIDLLRELRQLCRTPVIVVSARGQESIKIDALDAGADDYLTKPFGAGELLARLRAVRRRQPTSESDNAVLSSGPIAIDVTRHEATLNGERLNLTPIEFKLLHAMLKNVGRVLTHQSLLREVWGPGYAGQKHYVRIYMNSLRRKLQSGPARRSYISTEVGIGYRLRDDMDEMF